jgi:hypothetical protein
VLCEPASVGAGSGVDAGVVVVSVPVVTVVAASGFVPPPFSAIIVWTAYAIASARTAASAITVFFCFAAFALAASATFFLAICRSSRAD